MGSVSVNDTEKPSARYTLRPTFTPLPHKPQRSEGAGEASARPADGRPADEPTADAAQAANVPDSTVPRAASKPGTSSVRAANEDDDLYDPYSDFHDGTLKPLEFERDPWR